MIPIEFGVSRSKVKIAMTFKLRKHFLFYLSLYLYWYLYPVISDGKDQMYEHDVMS